MIEKFDSVKVIEPGDEIRFNGEWLEIDVKELVYMGILFTCSTDEGAQRQFIADFNHNRRYRSHAG